MALVTRGNNMRLLRGGKVRALIMPGRPRNVDDTDSLEAAIRSLFAAGEQGAWYDPSDFSTMFQDAAGTTPVTAIEQPVGRILDKSGRGNTATQSTTTSRPILRNLYNLLQYTEQFDNAAWSKLNANGDSSGVIPVVTQNAGTDPLGGNTADRVVFSRGTTAGRSYLQQTGGTGTANTSYTLSLWVKSNTGSNQIITLFGNFGTGPQVMITATTEWQRFTCVGSTITAASLFYLFGYHAPAIAGTSADVLVWGATLIPTNEASVPYQRVVTNTLGSGVYDTDVTKFPPYLFFDGTDDWLQTANIDFSATDKMSVFAGFRWVTGAGVLYETSASADTTNGTMLCYIDSSFSPPRFRMRGTVQPGGVQANTPITAPTTKVFAVQHDIGADTTTVKQDGASAVFNKIQTTSPGNFASNQPLYICRRADTTLPFNGRIYSLIIRGELTSSPQLEQTEQWIAAKTGVTL